jgi:hypothetical protein
MFDFRRINLSCFSGHGLTAVQFRAQSLISCTAPLGISALAPPSVVEDKLSFIGRTTRLLTLDWS